MIRGRSLGALASVIFLALSAASLPADTTSGASRWPMYATTSEGAQVTIFQPQMEDFQGDTLTARAAVSVTASTGAQPVFGAIWLQSRVSTDRVARTVHIEDVKVTRTRFPDASPVSEPALAAAVEQAILSQDISLSLDQLLEQLETIQKAQTAAQDLQSAPPAIVFKDHPAVKVQYDGAPRLTQAENSPVLRAVNTPFFVAIDPSVGKTYYLKGAGRWFSAPDPMGPFTLTQQVPPSISDLATSSGYQDPQQTTSPEQAAATESVEIVASTSPTELIWTDGAPQLTPISGTDLLYWANTTSDVFMDIQSQHLFVLLSGRWFTAANQNGPWGYVAPDKLPPDFAHIPTDSEKASVLACVAGTDQANDAVADTYLPQTAAVDLKNFDQPTVVYDGDPNFVAISGANCSYADNCETPVVLCDGGYYCCYNAVWYLSPHSNGPWVVCRRVPRPIYAIPPSCPIYSCRFCYVYGVTDDVVYVGYTPGYVGCYAFDGIVVYGTGFNYAPWAGRHYFSRPCTFGWGASYDPYFGHWGFNVAVASGGGVGWFRTTHQVGGRGGDWFGFGGYRPTFLRTGAHIDPKLIALNNASIHRGQAADARIDAFARNLYDRRKDVRPEIGLRTPEPMRGQPIPAIQPDRKGTENHPQPDDVFSDRNGNVFRKTDNGWQSREKGQWTPFEVDRGNQNGNGQKPSPAPGEQPKEQPQHESPPSQEQPQAQPDHGDRGNGSESHADNQPQHQDRGSNGDLDRDYHAREAGDNRERQYQPSDSGRSEDRGGGGGSDRSGGASDRGGGGGGGGGGNDGGRSDHK